MTRFRSLFVLVMGACIGLAFARTARADTDTDALVASAVAALSAGKPGEAVTTFEALADRGVVDANMSLDRGLAYAERVRLGADLPGDLGRAAHGFEEARTLTADPAVAADATRALALVRAEVARRRARAGEPPGVDPGVPLFRSIVQVASENAWAALALIASILLGAGLFVRTLSSARRGRISGAIAASMAAPALVFFVIMALAARDDRLHHREAVVVATSARPTDDDHRPLEQAPQLPEAARVDVTDSRAGWTHVHWASVDGWVPTSSVRAIAIPD